MTPVKRVVCPIDFSDFSRRALDYGLAVAAWYGVPLDLLYVHHVPDPIPATFAGLAAEGGEGPVLSLADRDQVRRELQGLLPAASPARVAVQCSVCEGGDIASEILAETDAGDLIVMGTHGRSGFEHLLIGSVTEKVLHRARGPVLTIGRDTPRAAHAVPGLFHHILVAVDFSHSSELALQYALALAEEADAHLTLLHVLEVPRYLERWLEASGDGTDHFAGWKAEAHAELRALVPADTREQAHVDERVEVGVTYREILAVAASQQTGLIIIGAHSGGASAHAPVGATTQHVVRGAVCPVLTVRG